MIERSQSHRVRSKASVTVGGRSEIESAIQCLVGRSHRVAIDTEYGGRHTLLVQTAMIRGKEIVVQLFRSPAIPEPDRDEIETSIRQFLATVPFAAGLSIRVLRTKVLHKQLSPLEILCDLLEIECPASFSRADGVELRRGQAPAVSVGVEFVGHFLPADLLRLFGAGPNHKLLNRSDEHAIDLSTTALPGFVERNRRYAGGNMITLEYLKFNDALIPVKVGFRDTIRPFGKGSLDELAHQFLGVGKGGFSEEEKAAMDQTFVARTDDAYCYAIRDVVLTLLLDDAMQAEHQTLLRELELDRCPMPMPRTTGSRVDQIIVADIARAAVEIDADAETFEREMRWVKRVLKKGSSNYLGGLKASRLGRQPFQTHGGLIFSRSPTDLFHEGVGRFFDADLEGAYANVAAEVTLYAGQPVVVYPGRNAVRRADAMRWLKRNSAGWDAFYVVVSGKIPSGCNTLIPSVVDAVTAENYRRHAPNIGKADSAEPDRRRYAKTVLTTGEIKSGVVGLATWQVIKLMPEAIRSEFQNLRVEAMVFYPKSLTVDSRAAYHRLFRRLEERVAGPGETRDFDFEEEVDLENLCVRKKDFFTGDHVAFAHPLSRVMDAMMKRRQEAKRKFNRGSAAERGAKEFCNAVYGVIASPFKAVNNVVAANTITSTVRALAFLMQTSLNGFQVVTDGCTFRVDEVPDSTLAECLDRAPLYLIRRPERSALPWLKPNDIPEDDKAFTSWYRRHVKRFMGIEGEHPGLDWLLSFHRLSLKEVGGRKSFDALVCIGAADHIKYLGKGKDLTAVDLKLRGLSEKAKLEVEAWLTPVVQSDCFKNPRLFEDRKLLGVVEAGSAAAKALLLLRRQTGRKSRVYYPLGFSKRLLKRFGLVRMGGFLFETQRKWKAWKKADADFRREHGTGFDLLALRRRTAGRDEGSILAVLNAIFAKIRGGKSPHNALNLGRTDAFEGVANAAKRDREGRIEDLDFEFAEAIDFATASKAERLTGWHVTLGVLRSRRRPVSDGRA
jgi:hypothetical protein